MIKGGLLLIVLLMATSYADAQNRFEIAGFAGIVNEPRSQGGGGEEFMRPGISGHLNLTRKLGFQFDYAGRRRTSQNGTDSVGNFTEQTWRSDYFSTSLVYALHGRASRFSPCIYAGFAFRRSYQWTTSTEPSFNFEGSLNDSFFDLGGGANWDIHSHWFVRSEFRAWVRPEIDSSSFIRAPVLRVVLALGYRFGHDFGATTDF